MSQNEGLLWMVQGGNCSMKALKNEKEVKSGQSEKKKDTDFLHRLRLWNQWWGGMVGEIDRYQVAKSLGSPSRYFCQSLLVQILR